MRWRRHLASDLTLHLSCFISSMRLFIITQSVDSTHSALGFFVEWIRGFRKHPIVSSVDVASFDHSNEQVDDVSVHRVSSADRLGRIREMWGLLMRTDWDVLFVHMTPIWCVMCWPIVFIKRKKMVLWYTHGSSSVALRIACMLAKEIYTATRNAFPISSSRVLAVGHGISPAFFNAQRSSGNGHRYLMVGRRSRRKRVVETVELFARIRAIDPNALFDWVGERMDETYEVEIEQTVKRLNLTDAVHFIGPVSAKETHSTFANYDLLLHLSATGSLDKVAIEALASGCAVFSTNPASRDGLGDRWFYSGDLDDSAAAEAVRRAREGVTNEERKRIADQYDLSILIDRLVKLMSVQIGRRK